VGLRERLNKKNTPSIHSCNRLETYTLLYAMLQGMSFVLFHVNFEGIELENPKTLAILNISTSFYVLEYHL